MKKTKFSEEQMIGAVKQLEAGRSARDLARELGISDQTLDNWRAKYSGLEVNEARRLRALEDENRRLKTMVADLSLDKEALKVVIRKKRLELVSARRDVAFVMTEFRSSERQACTLLDLDRSSHRYEARPDRNIELREQLIRLPGGRSMPSGYGLLRRAYNVALESSENVGAEFTVKPEPVCPKTVARDSW
ncbi:MAG: hypothetical protein KatS3mg004_3732 [Bryobacteraceae bacterium]|nr:MAG: hypothetical protein KatS3mg004_3732 [Bryobacteraceae bacterium]